MEKMQPKGPQDLGRKNKDVVLPDAGSLDIRETYEAIVAVGRIATKVAEAIVNRKSMLDLVYEIAGEWKYLQQAIEGGHLIPQEMADLAPSERNFLLRQVLYVAADILAAVDRRHSEAALYNLADRLVDLLEAFEIVKDASGN